MKKVTKYISRKTLIYKTDVEYGDYTMNHVLGCSHGCKYPCYAYLQKKRFGNVTSYEDWWPNDPAFATPGNMPERIAACCRASGQGEFSGRAELLRCIYESLAQCFCEKLHELEKVRGGKYEKLHILGGGTKDSFLMQLTANRIGIPVLAGPVEATAAGNLLAQLIASGELKDLADSRRLIAASFPLKEYQPQKKQ